MSRTIYNGREKRSYVRIDTELPARFRIYGMDSAKHYSGTTKNISQGGLCLEIVQDQNELIETLFKHQQWPSVDVELSLPDRQGEPSIKVDWIAGRLDWAQKPSGKDPALLIGMGFVDMREEARRLIYEFVLNQFLKRYQPELRVRPPVYAVR